MFEKIEAASQQLDTTGPAQPEADMVLDAAGSVSGTTSNSGSAGPVYERGLRDYTVASRPVRDAQSVPTTFANEP